MRVQGLKKMIVLNPTSNNLNRKTVGTSEKSFSAESHYFGLKTYPESLEIQQQAHREVQKQFLKDHASVHILGFEYDRVLTLGRRVQKSDLSLLTNNLEDSEMSFETKKVFSSQQISSTFFIYQSDRGGLVTLHNKGQLVIYPVLSLRGLDLGVREYLRYLCLSTELLLQKYFNLECSWNQENPDGVFVAGQKVAFIGVRVENGITKHGISLNICNDLTQFNLFVPCGNKSLQIGSLHQHLQPNVGLPEFFGLWTEIFCSLLKERLS